MHSGSLASHVAIVTGASGGIGFATARQLALAGAHVVCVGRRAERLEALVERIGQEGGTAEAYEADLTQASVCDELVGNIVDRLGRLDILVNSAGVMFSGPTLESPVEDWQSMIDVNLTSLLRITKSALPHMVAAAETNPRGVVDIVNISSLAGRVAKAENAVYNATKFGVTAFSEALRQEFTRRNVRVSVIEPGLVQTEIFDRQREAGRRYFEKIREGIEILTPDDVAETILFVVTRARRVGLNEITLRSIEQG